MIKFAEDFAKKKSLK